jgi:hypothetical protein
MPGWPGLQGITIAPMTRTQSEASLTEYQHAAEFRAALRRFLRVSEDASRKHGSPRAATSSFS